MKIGLALPTAPFGAQSHIPTYQDLRAIAQQADQGGLDSIWISDHLIFAFPDHPPQGVLEAWTVLTGLAEATERVQLGTIVLCTAFRNPAVLAKMAVTLDEVSNQRLILGLGSGWHEPEFTMFGIPHDHLVDRFEDAINIIAPLVREGRVDFQGKYYAAIDAKLLPPPTRPIPIMIAALRPRMMRLTAQYADSWNMINMSRPEELQELRDALTAASQDVGRDPATLEITAGINVGYPDLGEVRVDGPGVATTVLTGTTEEIAAGLRAWEASGAGHLMVMLQPLNGVSVARFIEAVELARN